MKKWFFVFAATLLSVLANAQPALRLRGLKPASPVVALKTRAPGRFHLLVQFAHNPSSAELALLTTSGATVLSYVPDFAFSISIREGASLEGLGIARIHRLRPDEKMSAEFDATPVAAASIAALVEFYRDVDASDTRAIASEAGVRILENADLLPNHLLVRGTREQVQALAGWDEVSYVFPASEDLIHGTPVRACAGALTSQGSVGQAIPLIGDGWDGPGLGAASLKYAFENVPQQLPQDAVESEIVRAFDEWAKHAQLTFTPSDDPTGNQTIAILFATGEHGDGYPFVGKNVLAHTFYPFPVDPEPIAGDMHFNDAQTWQIGTGLDVYSVALHETGHALGLGHSDKPGDVMYPYYRMHTTLMPNDIAALQELYAAPAAAANPNPQPTPAPAPPQVSPLVIAVVAPPSSVTVSPLSITGTTSGGSGSVQVNWTSGTASGTAQGSSSWMIPAIPLSSGVNVITITAQDSQYDQVSSSVTVSYQPPSPSQPAPNPPSSPNPPPNPNPPAPNPNPPQGPDTTPPSLTILSPATSNYSTSQSSLVVSGAATDNVGVVSVTWTTSNGTSGTANGTTNWSTPPIPLYIGDTTIVITAADAAGNTSWRSLTVTRN